VPDMVFGRWKVKRDTRIVVGPWLRVFPRYDLIPTVTFTLVAALMRFIHWGFVDYEKRIELSIRSAAL
jgi:hypothetical protein